MVEQKHNRRMSCNFPYFFEILNLLKQKTPFFRTFQRNNVMVDSLLMLV